MAIDTTARKRKRTKKKHTHKRWPRYGDLSLSISSSFRVYKQEKQSCASALLCSAIEYIKEGEGEEEEDDPLTDARAHLFSSQDQNSIAKGIVWNTRQKKKNERRSSSIKSYSITIKINFNFFEDFFSFQISHAEKKEKKKFIFVLFALICSDITEYRAKRRKKNRNVGTHVLS